MSAGAPQCAPGDSRLPVFFVGGGRSDTVGVTAEAVGSKAYNLMRMDRVGLPVPPAFVIGADACREFLRSGGRTGPALAEALAANVRRLEDSTGTSFGGRRRPLLVSVRSGAAVSMPGMMESVLNVGLNDITVEGFIRHTGNPRLAWDCYRRLVQSYANLVHGCSHAPFDALVARELDPVLFPTPRELDAVTLRRLTRDSLERVAAVRGAHVAQDPMVQLDECVKAVFRSWMSDKARAYRALHGIDEAMGTAVTVQAMVFGNAGGTSGSGVGFTRDPASGDNALYLDFLFNAQGEDVVSGRRLAGEATRLEVALPQVYARLRHHKDLLEREFGDLQDFEFTVQDAELWLLQTRSAARTSRAALQIAVDMVDEGLIDVATALARVQGLDLDATQRVELELPAGAVALAQAIPAGIGVASGVMALDSETAQRMVARGLPVILVREEIATDDFTGIAAADGILTARGGRTSHAAVVAREMDKACLVGCATLRLDLAARRCHLGTVVVKEGDWLSLDAHGRIFAGRSSLVRARPEHLLARIEAWRRELAPA